MVVFAKGWRVPIGAPGGWVRGRFKGGGVPVKNKGKGQGRRVRGVGWGPAKEPASQCASFVETTLSNLPFSFSPKCDPS